jgi:hypothetical protein
VINFRLCPTAFSRKVTRGAFWLEPENIFSTAAVWTNTPSGTAMRVLEALRILKSAVVESKNRPIDTLETREALGGLAFAAS